MSEAIPYVEASDDRLTWKISNQDDRRWRVKVVRPLGSIERFSEFWGAVPSMIDVEISEKTTIRFDLDEPITGRWEVEALPL